MRKKIEAEIELLSLHLAWWNDLELIEDLEAAEKIATELRDDIRTAIMQENPHRKPFE